FLYGDRWEGRGSHRSGAAGRRGAAQPAAHGRRPACDDGPRISSRRGARDLLRQLRSRDAGARPVTTAELSPRRRARLRHVSADRARRDALRARAGGRMKYFVRVGESEVELSRDGDEVLVDGATLSARLADVEGTPVRMLTVGDEVHRIVVRP